MLDFERWIERLAVELSDARREVERLREQIAKVDGLEKQNLDLHEKVRIYRQSQIEAVELYEQTLRERDHLQCRKTAADERAVNAKEELALAQKRIVALEQASAGKQKANRRKAR